MSKKLRAAIRTAGILNRRSALCASPGIIGIFHKVSEKHLPLYLNEFAFRFNNRDEFNLMDKVLSECF